MKESTINVRLDATLKQHGMEVLDSYDVSVTEVVRALFQYLEDNRTLPPGLMGENRQEDLFRRRRQLMKSMIGTIPQDVTLSEAREARLSHHCA